MVMRQSAATMKTDVKSAFVSEMMFPAGESVKVVVGKVEELVA